MIISNFIQKYINNFAWVLKVLRFKNKEVMNDLPKVLAQIESAALSPP